MEGAAKSWSKWAFEGGLSRPTIRAGHVIENFKFKGKCLKRFRRCQTMLEQRRSPLFGQSIGCPWHVKIHNYIDGCNAEITHSLLDVIAHHINGRASNKRRCHANADVIIRVHGNVRDDTHVNNGDCWDLRVTDSLQGRQYIVTGHATTARKDPAGTPLSSRQAVVRDVPCDNRRGHPEQH